MGILIILLVIIAMAIITTSYHIYIWIFFGKIEDLNILFVPNPNNELEKGKLLYSKRR